MKWRDKGKSDAGEQGSGRVVIRVSAFAIIAFFFWAHWAQIDQITRATGQVIASSRNQIIQAPDGGVLMEVPVKEGTRVKRGQLLVRFDRTKTQAAYQESATKAASLQAAVARLTAEVYGGVPNFPSSLDKFPDVRENQRVLFNRRQAAIHEEIAALEKALGLAKEELAMNQPLVKSGDVSRSDILKLQRQVADIQGQITNRRNKYLQDSQTDLAKAQEDLDGVKQVLTQRKEQLDYTELRSPMDGIVRNVRLTTQGGVAKPGEEVMQVVPMDDDLIIEAKVRPADIAFVKPGLPATVKLDAYDYTVYGTLKGEVAYISADTLNEEVRGNEIPYYRVQVKTRGRNLLGRSNERIDIQPGMTATLEIKTGSNTILSYLTKPVTKTLGESFGER
ncbi:MAG: HlyD family type I secretion periplasmic adaptor subunit [Rhodocyclaceae bacterium]|nr:HlyD family type I secretion periplasmic adaptor subunit [Rhodocyclaceae bacterium]